MTLEPTPECILAREHLMSIRCCTEPSPRPRRACCPVTGTPGVLVELHTVKALLTNAALATLSPTSYYFCPEPDCDVVYFAPQGKAFHQADVRTTVWQKAAPGGRTICYCFGETEDAIRGDVARSGASDVVERVRAHIAAGRCACDIRNPRGTCCLGDLHAAVRRFRSETPGVSHPQDLT